MEDILKKTKQNWHNRLSELYIQKNRHIGQVNRVFANGPGDLGSLSGNIIPKTLKMILDTSLLNTQQYKVRIKGKTEQSRERSSALPYTSVKEPSDHPRLKGDNFTFTYLYTQMCNWVQVAQKSSEGLQRI